MGLGGRRRLTGFTVAVATASVASALTLQTASAAHAVFDNNPFTSGADVVTTLTNCNVGGLGNGLIGPVGLLNDGTSFFVDDWCTQRTYKLPASGGAISGATTQAANGLTGGLTLVGSTYYGLVQNGVNPVTAPGGAANAGVYTFDPTTLAATHVISIPGDTTSSGTYDRSLIGDAAGNNLYIGTSNGIYRLTLPGHVLTRFDTCSPPKTAPLCSGNWDGIALNNAGTVLYAADPTINSNVVEFDISTGNPIRSTQISGGVAQGSDGLVVAPSGSMPNNINVGDNLFINTNDGHIQRYVPGSTPTVTEAANSGTRGDLATTDPQGCVYVTQSATIEKLLPCLGPSTGIPEVPLLPMIPAVGALVVGGMWLRGRQTNTVTPTAR